MARVDPPSMMSSYNWGGNAAEEQEDDELPLGRQTLKLRSQAIVNEAALGVSPPKKALSPAPPPIGENAISYGSWPPAPSLPPSQPLPPSHQPPSSISAYVGRPGASQHMPSSQQHMPMYGSQYPQLPGGAAPTWQGQPGSKGQWSLTPEMMNQPWGTVLRTLNRT